MLKYNPIWCAIDTADLTHAKKLANDLKEHIGGIKLGLEFFIAHGEKAIREMSDILPVFLDLKFHDIPNTVYKAVRNIVKLNIFMTTIHASGGFDMMKAALDAANEESDKLLIKPPLILAVTVLTSFNDQDMNSIGVPTSINDQVDRLASLARSAKIDGIVCSPQELKNLKRKFGSDLKFITPGIRPVGSNTNDQKRTLTPNEAILNGADYLVIGRPITDSTDPVASAQNIVELLSK